jgi:hypothetical protein
VALRVAYGLVKLPTGNIDDHRLLRIKQQCDARLYGPVNGLGRKPYRSSRE